jgi:hypothetical protein
MKNVLTFYGGSQLHRSDMSVVPRANESLSPGGAKCSETSPDDAAPGRSLDFLWRGDATNMSALTGLGAGRRRIQGFPRPFKAIKAYSILFKGFWKKILSSIPFILSKLCPQPYSTLHNPIKAFLRLFKTL